MTRGIEVEDVVVGTGDPALRGKVVIARVRTFLNHGTEVAALCGPRMMIDLGRRECIAGLRHGIEGMRVGGVRRLIVAPHLAYGAQGLPDRVPPNALLRCEVELLEVREPGVVKPEDFPGGTALMVFHPGEAARNPPRWQFHLDENGRCGIALEFPIPGMTWRHTRRKAASVQVDPAAARTLFESAINLPDQFPAECLHTEELWADKTEPANSITRDRRSNSLCITISVWEAWQQRMYYSLSETSPALLGSELYRVIRSLLQANVVADTLADNQASRNAYACQNRARIVLLIPNAGLASADLTRGTQRESRAAGKRAQRAGSSRRAFSVRIGVPRGSERIRCSPAKGGSHPRSAEGGGVAFWVAQAAQNRGRSHLLPVPAGVPGRR